MGGAFEGEYETVLDQDRGKVKLLTLLQKNQVKTDQAVGLTPEDVQQAEKLIFS